MLLTRKAWKVKLQKYGTISWKETSVYKNEIFQLGVTIDMAVIMQANKSTIKIKQWMKRYNKEPEQP